MKWYPKTFFSTLLTKSYIVIFCIPLLFSIVLYFISNVYIQQYSDEFRNIELERNESFIQDFFTELNNVYTELNSHPYIKGNQSLSAFEAAELKTTLININSQSPNLFEDIQIYYNDYQYAVSMRSGDSIRNMYNAMGSDLLQTYEEWETLMQQYSNGNIFNYNRGIVYQKSLKNTVNYSNITMFIFIPSQYLFSQNSNVKLYSDTDIALLNHEDEVVYQNDMLPFDQEELKNLVNDAAYHAPRKITHGLSSYIVQCGSYYDFTYMILIGEHNIIATFRIIISVFIVGIFITFLLGLFAIRRFVLLNTQPIQTILNLLPAHDSDSNEFNTIQQWIKTSSRQLSRSKPFVIDSFISSIIHDHDFSNMPLEFSYDTFQWILFFPSDAGIYTPNEGENSSQLRSLMYTALDNISDELLSSYGQVYHSVQNNMLVTLLNTNTPINNEQLLNIYTTINEYLNIQGYITLSEPVHELHELHTAYATAKSQLDHLEMLGHYGTDTEDTEDTVKSGDSSKYIDIFTTNVIHGHLEDALETVKQMIRSCAENRKTITDVRLLLLNMLNSAISTMEENINADLGNALEQIALNNKIIDANSTTQMLEVVNEFLLSVKSFWDMDAQEQNLEERVAAFIRYNFTDCNINLKYLADRFNITPAYLSSKFKAYWNMSIIEYIANTRIEKAKGLLAKTNHSLEEISTACGYTNTVTFSRQFKAYTGTSPGKFRQSHHG